MVLLSYRAMTDSLDQVRIRRLLDIGRVLVTELSLEVVLDEILAAARELTGARYAALGVLNERRTGLGRFVTLGIDAKTRRTIGDLPRGRGVLGVLIEDPVPLRTDDVSGHPRSYGLPDGHPPMHSFLGVPILIRGESWGNLYLTEKEGEAFTDGDEEAAVILADWAATAIDNARLYETSERRRNELERAVRGFEATHDIAIAMGVRLPIDRSTSGQVLEHARAERISDVTSRLRIQPAELGVPDAHTALLVPMISRGQTVGVLAAFDRGPENEAFSEEDEQLLRMFAATAANAVAMAQSVEADRLRSALAAADEERRRFARELHDETLQGLGALKVLLSSVLQRDDPEQNEAVMREAVDEIETAIGNLRGIISDLRPAALDDLGLRAALRALIERREQDDLEITSELLLPDARAGEARLSAELETTVYRLVQEALTNIVKHARAHHVRVMVIAKDGEVNVEVRDDGAGFEVDGPTAGFGLTGIRERVYLAGGRLEIESGRAGTVLRGQLPERRGSDLADGSRGQKLAS